MTTLALNLLRSETGHTWVAEHRFGKRRSRFDYACLSLMVAIEVEGGVWVRGRHTRGKGFIEDMKKYNHATVLGWRVLRYTPDQFNDLVWIDDVNAISERQTT